MGERIWIPYDRLPDDIDRATLAEKMAFPNLTEVTQELERDCKVPRMNWDAWPKASPLKIDIAVPELALDFWRSPLGPVISARLRDAWAPASDAVEYVAVDLSGSCEQAREQDYRLMHVFAKADVVDPEKSDYDTADHLAWLPKGFPFYVKSFAIRSDAAPSVMLFRDTFAPNHIFCTDELAIRALLAECTGVRFVDPATQCLLQPMRYRVIGGIAETGDYDVNKQHVHMRLVEKIPLMG